MSALLAFIMGNLWRSAAIGLFAALVVQALLLSAAQRASAAAETRAIAANVERDAARQLEQSTAATWELRNLELQRALSECQRQWRELDTRSRDAVQLAMAGRAAAETTLHDYRNRFDARSQHCGAALIDAQAACPELEGY